MAISLCAVIQVYKERKGVVNLDFFLDKMDENLLCHLIIAHSSLLTQALQAIVCTMYDLYPDGVKLPLFHPIIGYLVSLWDTSMDKSEFFDMINLSEVAAKCGEVKPNSIGVWVDTHMVLAKVSVVDAAVVKQVEQ